MSYIKEFITFLTPATIIGATVTYWFGIRQKRFEINQEHYKKIRVTTSSLLTIWWEYAALEKLLKSKDKTNELAFKIPEIATEYLKIDEKKVKKMNKSFSSSLENLKEIDVVLFYELEGCLDGINKTNREIFEPLFDDLEGINDEKINLIIPVLDELIEDLEKIILDTIKYLPRRERGKVHQILDKHIDELRQEDKNEIPLFIVKWINNSLKPKTPLTQEDFYIFYSNDTIKWMISKCLSIDTFKEMLFSKKSKIGGVRFLLAIIRADKNKIQEYFPLENLSKFDLSKEELLIFVDNKPFYRLIMGLVLKIEGNVPMWVKRDLVKFNTGLISFHKDMPNLDQ